MIEQLNRMIEDIRELNPIRYIGRVSAAEGGKITISGLATRAKLGDRVLVDLEKGSSVSGEVVKIQSPSITVIPDGVLTGISLGSRVVLQPVATVNPCQSWLGRVLDSNANPLDGKPLRRGFKKRPLTGAPPDAAKRKRLGQRLRTGSHALNTFLPLVEGQRVGLFAGSGVGKSSLLGILARNVDCDVVVLALVGERGRELRHFVSEVLGEEGMKNCVVVAATSDKSALERRRCAMTAMSIAEHFRDAGKSVLFLADSITRLAEAHREIATTSGEMPVLRGFPPSTAQMITELCERAGPGEEGQGDITAVFSVLVPGSDMDEPVADILRGVLDGHIVLDRSIAERGRYPAINLLQSVSRSLPAAASDCENKIISEVRAAVSLYSQNEMMIRSGLYTPGSDAALDKAIKLWYDVDSFLGTCDSSTNKDSFNTLGLILRRSGHH